MAPKQKTIRQTVTIKGATPAQVYQAFVDAKQHAAITGAPARGAAREGAKVSAFGGYITAHYLELDPGCRVVQAWRTSDFTEDAPDSLFDLTLAAVPGGTKVTLVHSDVPAGQADDYAHGWTEYYWQPLQKHFAALAGRGGKRPAGSNGTAKAKAPAKGKARAKAAPKAKAKPAPKAKGKAKAKPAPKAKGNVKAKPAPKVKARGRAKAPARRKAAPK
jgi:uncharacterized protein YndB with AHSA1/START domain